MLLSSFLVKFDSVLSHVAFPPSMSDGVASVKSTCIIEELLAAVADVSTENVGLESDASVGASAQLTGMELFFGNSVKEADATDSASDCWEHKSS